MKASNNLDGNLDSDLDSIHTNPKNQFATVFEESQQKHEPSDPTENLNVPSTEIAMPMIAMTHRNK